MLHAGAAGAALVVGLSAAAPAFEESVKIVGLVYLAHRGRLAYVADGAVAGFAIGAAFAAAENVLVLATGDAAVHVALQRALSTSLAHGCATALAGAVLGRLHFWRRLRVVAVGLAVGLATSWHAGFNAAVAAGIPALAADLHLPANAAVNAVVAAAGVASVAVVAALIGHGVRREEGWLAQELAPNSGDSAPWRLTPAERALVDLLPHLHEALTSVALRFGETKRAQVERLIQLDARIALWQQVRDASDDGGHRAALDADLARLASAAQAARRETGAACLAYVASLSWACLRAAYPPEHAGDGPGSAARLLPPVTAQH